MEYWEFVRAVAKRAANGHERPGQALFNVLDEVYPDIADRMRGTSLDPFACRTKDAKYYAAVDYIISEWPVA